MGYGKRASNGRVTWWLECQCAAGKTFRQIETLPLSDSSEEEGVEESGVEGFILPIVPHKFQCI